MRKYEGFTGGSEGLRISPLQTPGYLDGVLDRVEWLYFLALITAALMLLVAWVIVRGPLGRAFIAVRDSEVAAEAMGINIARTKITAFTISSFFAGIAGGLYTQVIGFVSPDAISIFQSISLLAVVVIGGLATIAGSVIGGVAFILLPSDAPNLVGQIPGLGVDIVKRSPGAIQGAIVIATILLLPSGIAGSFRALERLTPASVAAAVREAPARVAGGVTDLVERFSWAWDLRPRASRSGGRRDDPP
jgi:branched-chain amino acid transport system permease protein